jgi:hypothetical protein
MAVNEIERALSELDVNALVGELFETPTMDAFMATYKPSSAQLTTIVEQKQRKSRAQFAALFILYKKDSTAYNAITTDRRAAIYCDALADEYFESEEPWGKLWENDQVGLMGYHVLAQGSAAVPYLAKLLNNSTVRSSYHGSEAATLMAMRQYRLKDFAAYYIAKIKGYDLPWKAELPERDNAIDKLRADLGI